MERNTAALQGEESLNSHCTQRVILPQGLSDVFWGLRQYIRSTCLLGLFSQVLGGHDLQVSLACTSIRLAKGEPADIKSDQMRLVSKGNSCHHVLLCPCVSQMHELPLIHLLKQYLKTPFLQPSSPWCKSKFGPQCCHFFCLWHCACVLRHPSYTCENKEFLV